MPQTNGAEVFSKTFGLGNSITPPTADCTGDAAHVPSEARRQPSKRQWQAERKKTALSGAAVGSNGSYKNQNYGVEREMSLPFVETRVGLQALV